MIVSVHFLRFISAIAVVLYHISYKVDLPSYFNVGEIGVDVFFIISGFVIYLSTDNKVISPKSFISGRFYRIYPLYFLFTLIALIAYFLFPSLVNSGRESSIVSSFLLLPSNKPYLLGVAWTLVYEIMFYMIFLVSMLFTYKYRAIVCTGILFSLWLSRCIVEDSSFNIYYYFYSDAIIFEFVIGVFFGFIYCGNESKSHLVSYSLMLFVCIFIIYYLEPGHRLIRYCPIASVVFLVFLFMEPVFLMAKGKIGNIFMILGSISYVLYLTHSFVLSGVNKLISYELYNLKLIVMILLSVIFSLIIHFNVEIKIKNKVKEWSVKYG
ncbi:acyltransferase [Vibrio fluvialis]|nr:acyltransferase [Vibrio fluvialis]